ncbi:MAG: response regulator [Elusimicrobiota bacterium]
MKIFLVYSSPESFNKMEKAVPYGIEMIKISFEEIEKNNLNLKGFVVSDSDLTELLSDYVLFDEKNNLFSLFLNKSKFAELDEENFKRYLEFVSSFQEKTQKPIGVCSYNSDIYKDWPWLNISGDLKNLFGIENIKFKENIHLWKTRIHPQDAKILAKRKSFLISNGSFEFIFRFMCEDNYYRWFISKEHSDPDSSVTTGVIIDIDSFKTAYEKENVGKKMDYLYGFIDHTNHEINNLFSSVLGYMNIVDEKMERSNPVYQEIREISSLLKKGFGLFERYLVFSNKEVIKKEKVNLAEVIDSLRSLIRVLIRKDIKGIVVIEEKEAYVEGDKVLLQQIIAGLCVYVSEVVTESGELKISLKKTKKITLKSSKTLDYEEKDFIVVNISGDMSFLDIMRIKDIYSMNLGLDQDFSSIFSLKKIRDNIEKMGGWLKIDSLNNSLFFEVYFPSESKKDNIPLEVCSKPRNKVGKILVCEDDGALRKFVSRVLRENGYQVNEAVDIASAIEVLKKNTDTDLIFTDIDLPDGNSFDFIEEIRKISPDIKVVFNSGFVDSKSRWKEITSLGFSFLQKPYTIRDLLNLIEKELNSGNKK